MTLGIWALKKQQNKTKNSINHVIKCVKSLIKTYY